MTDIKIKILTDEAFENLPTKATLGADIKDSAGFTNTLTGEVYVRNSGFPRLNRWLVNHEVDHLFEDEASDADERIPAIRHIKFRRLLGNIAGFLGPIAGALIPGLGPILGPAIGGAVGGALKGGIGGRKRSVSGALKGGAIGGGVGAATGFATRGFGIPQTGAVQGVRQGVGTPITVSGPGAGLSALQRLGTGFRSGFGIKNVFNRFKGSPPTEGVGSAIRTSAGEGVRTSVGATSPAQLSQAAAVARKFNPPTSTVAGGGTTPIQPVGPSVVTQAVLPAARLAQAGGQTGPVTGRFGAGQPAAPSPGGGPLPPTGGSQRATGTSRLISGGGATDTEPTGRLNLRDIFGNPLTQIGLATAAGSQLLGSPDVPELPPSAQRFQARAEQGGPISQVSQDELREITEADFNVMSEQEIEAGLRQFRQTREDQREQIDSLYRSLQPGTDPSTNSSYRRDLAEFDEETAQQEADFVFNRTRELEQDFFDRKFQAILTSNQINQADLSAALEGAQFDIDQALAQFAVTDRDREFLRTYLLQFGGNLVASQLSPQPPSILDQLFGGGR